jgi:ABC-type bacteriocin/lantibiotic exporter with double-glycine peptidase domain
MVSWLEEVARFIDVFKLSGASNLPVKKSNDLVEKYIDHRTQHYRILRGHYFMLIGFKIITIAGLVVLGSILVMNEMISIGQFIASEIVMLLVIQSVEKIIFCIDPIYDTLTAVEKLGSIADIPVTEHSGTSEIPKGPISVVMNEVQVPDTKLQFTMEVSSNSLVAILGANGSGKSTLINALGTRIHNLKGNITYSGIRDSALNMDALRMRIGEITEDTDIFAGTVRENITLGRPGLSDEFIRSICEELGFWHELQHLSDGLSTKLVPGAPNIPRSLALKISIARGVITQPSLLLIDATLVTLTRSERTKIFNYLANGIR